VLNAKFHEKEAAIVAQAGRKGAVTVATNMAGRGTDIMLGGNPEVLATAELARRGLSPTETPEDFEAAWSAALETSKHAVEAEHNEVVGLGGLYVLGTERHDSRRIDNQLRGRSGRQGDPGESRFYLSLGDDLMRLFNAHMVESIMDRLTLPEDLPIESKMVSRSIQSAQTQIEQQNFEIRKNVLKYDEVLNKQRTVIYDERRRVLQGEDLHEELANMVDDVVTAYVEGATAEGYTEDWDVETLWTNLKSLYPVSVTFEEIDEHSGGGVSAEFLADEIMADAREAYVRREEQLGLGPDGEPVLRELERRVLLTVLDRRWREHLYEMDYLQEGIQLRGYGQRDPLVEYQREAYDMFTSMMDGIKEESVGFLFYADVNIEQVEDEQPDGVEVVPVDGDEGVASTGIPQSAGGQPAPLSPPAPLGQSAAPPPAPQAPQTPQIPQTAAPAAAVSPSNEDERAKVADVLGKAFGQPNRPTNLQYTAPTVDGEGGVQQSGTPAGASTGSFANASRNAPCPCGSGRKFKRCHGAPQNTA
jgi:preprotein translocase subunit SecA